MIDLTVRGALSPPVGALLTNHITAVRVNVDGPATRRRWRLALDGERAAAREQRRPIG